MGKQLLPSNNKQILTIKERYVLSSLLLNRTDSSRVYLDTEKDDDCEFIN